MKFLATGLSGCTIIQFDFHDDERGGFARAFCETEFSQAGIDFVIHQTNISRNIRRHTLRGMHYQTAPHGEPKMVMCTSGKIFDVAVDMRPRSPTFRRWFGLELCREAGRALHIAEGFAHGFLSLEPHSDVIYLMGAQYVEEAGRGIRWDDPKIAIQWPATPEVMSERDRSYPLLDRDTATHDV